MLADYQHSWQQLYTCAVNGPVVTDLVCKCMQLSDHVAGSSAFREPALQQQLHTSRCAGHKGVTVAHASVQEQV